MIAVAFDRIEEAWQTVNGGGADERVGLAGDRLVAGGLPAPAVSQLMTPDTDRPDAPAEHGRKLGIRP